MCISKGARLFCCCVTSCLVIVLQALFTQLHAQDNDSIGLFNPLTYTTQNTGNNGLVNSKVYTIHEDKAGALWFGTGAKVGRYYKGKWDVFLEDDGWDEYKGFWEKDSADLYFINYHGILHYEHEQAQHLGPSNTPGLLPYLHTSYVDAAGGLWVAGTDHGGTQYKIVSNSGEGWKEAHAIDLQSLGLRSDALLYSIFVQDDGKIWLSTYFDLLYYDGSSWRKMSNSVAGGGKFKFTQDAQGNLLLIDDGGVYTYKGGDFLRILSTGGSSNLEIDTEGNWWFGSQWGYLYKWDGQNFTTVALPSPLKENQTDQNNTIYAIRQVADGSLYIGTNFGAWHITNLQDVLQGAQQFNTFDGLPSNNITKILQDSRGVFWYGTSDGLSTFDGQQWQFISQLFKPHLATADGKVWCSKGPSNNFYLGYNTITVYDGQAWKDFSSYETGISEVTSIAQSPDGRIWAAGLTGMAVWDGVSWQKKFDDSRLKLYNLFADSKGTLWFDYYQENPRDPYNNGVGYYKDNQVHFFGDNDLLSHVYLNKIIEDRQGNIWFATYNHGLIRFNGQGLDIAKDVFDMGIANLRGNFISTVVEDEAGGVWAVYDFNEGLGASRYDGTSWTHFTTENGLPTNKIKDLFIAKAAVREEGSASGRINATAISSKVWIASPLGLNVLDLKIGKGKGNDEDVLGTENMQFADGVQYYPNPASSQITLHFHSQAPSRIIQLLDLQGRIRLQEHLANEQRVELSLMNLPHGLYLLRISDTRGTTTYKVVKE